MVWSMEHSSGNENTLIWHESCEMFMNEVTCENEVMEETQKNKVLQTKESKDPKKYELFFFFFFELLQISQRKSEGFIIEMPYVGHFLCE